MFNLNPDENVDRFLETLENLIEETDHLILVNYDAYLEANLKFKSTATGFLNASKVYKEFYDDLISIKECMNRLYNLQ